MRFSAVMSQSYENYDKAGFIFEYLEGPDTDLVGKTSTQYCEHVYTSIMAAGETVSATEYGGDYFFCFTINDLSVDTTYTFKLTPFVDEVQGEAVTVTFTVSADGTLTLQ